MAPQAVILAGGLATRLGALTLSMPKALVRVGGRPFLEYQLRWLRSAGVGDVLLLIGHLGDQIVERFGDGRAMGLSLRYHRDGDRPLGTGGALRAAAAMLSDAFVVLNGDTLVDLDLLAFWNAFQRAGCAGALAIGDPEISHGRPNVACDGAEVIGYDDAGATSEGRFSHVGVSAFRASALKVLEPGQKADIGALILRLIAVDRVLGWPVSSPFYDIGTPEGLARFAVVAPRLMRRLGLPPGDGAGRPAHGT